MDVLTYKCHGQQSKYKVVCVKGNENINGFAKTISRFIYDLNLLLWVVFVNRDFYINVFLYDSNFNDHSLCRRGSVFVLSPFVRVPIY